MSPRRSSRARTSQPQPAAPQQANSSTSSTSSGRADRSVRSHHKLPSPQSGAAPQSRSSEEVDGSVKSQLRRTRSSQDDAKADTKAVPEDGEDEEGEEEVTRCICGHLEYPGMPVPIGDTPKVSSKGNSNVDLLNTSPALPEDAGALFIQCDICKVWQHGGCVGIMKEATSPEEYFCEQCRKDLHRITSTASGQKYSRYLLVQELASLPSSPSPVPQDASPTKPKGGRSSRTNAEIIAGKRRSTMNSRDAAYDEAEQLRRAIEESKKEGEAPSASVSTRRGKRSRSDSEQRKEGTKRQRTSSSSSSSPSESKTLPLNADSDEEANQSAKTVTGSPKKLRGAAARNSRDKELREREEKREKERADAAGRRKGRAERRRGDDSDPSEESLSGATSSKGADGPMLSSITSHPPPPSTDHPLPKPSHKKTGRPPARRGRVGRNQYTKDRDAHHSDPLHPDLNTSPHRAHSQPRHGDNKIHLPNGRSLSTSNGHPSNSAGNGNGWANGNNNHHNLSENGKPSKPRHMNPNRTTMNEMKRRVSGILDFISRTQVEMATAAAGAGAAGGEEPFISASISRTRTRTHSTVTTTSTVAAPDGGKGASFLDGANGSHASDGFPGLNLETFVSLSSVEMMEVLTRGLMKWQGEYGKVGEK